MTVVRKTLSPQTIGDDQPRPGRSVFQAIFSVVDQVSGRFWSSATPIESAPRNCGQCSAPSALRRQYPVNISAASAACSWQFDACFWDIEFLQNVVDFINRIKDCDGFDPVIRRPNHAFLLPILVPNAN